MNRAQRRKAKRQGLIVTNDPIYNIKQSDINKIKRDSTNDAIDAAMILLLSIPIKVMHDKYGWGIKKRLPELSEALIDEYQSFTDGEMTLQEYQQLVYEYCGIRFERNED